MWIIFSIFCQNKCNSFLLWNFLAVIFGWFFIIFVLSSFDDDHESNNRNNKAKHPDNWKNHNTLRSFLWWFLFFQFFLFELFKWKPIAIMYLRLTISSSLSCSTNILGDNRQNLFYLVHLKSIYLGWFVVIIIFINLNPQNLFRVR